MMMKELLLAKAIKIAEKAHKNQTEKNIESLLLILTCIRLSLNLFRYICIHFFHFDDFFQYFRNL